MSNRRLRASHTLTCQLPACAMEFNVISKDTTCIIGSGVVVVAGVVNRIKKRVLSESIISVELLSIAAAESLQKMVQNLKKLVKN